MAQTHVPPSESSEPVWGDPTPEEIAQRSAEVRATWDEKTHEQRRVWKGRVEWSLPWIGAESVDVTQMDDSQKWL